MYSNYFNIIVDGNTILNVGADNTIKSLGKTLILGAGTHTFTANTGAFAYGGSAYIKNISVMGIIQ